MLSPNKIFKTHVIEMLLCLTGTLPEHVSNGLIDINEFTVPAYGG